MTLPIITWEPGIELDFEAFDRDNSERILNESLEQYMETLDQGQVDEALASGEPVEVIAYNCDMPSREECEFLDYLMEQLEEDRGDPDADSWEDTCGEEAANNIKAAQQAFIDVLLANYDPWGMKPVARIMVPMAEWLEANP